VQIRETFLFEGKIYIVMEHLSKGDLYFYLRKKEVAFAEADIQNIAAEIVVGLDILHRHGIVYRELKPENIMVTEQGHIKLTDYGLSKVIDNKNSISTFIGTLEYMAPEALKGEFGKKADVWALGILIFELMFRDSSSSGDDYEQNLERNNISKNINGRIGYMSLSFRDLLIKLLERNPDKRIALQEIRTHDFFREVDWGKVERRENAPPLKELIEKHDYIKLRDPNTEVCVRREFIKRKTLASDYQLKLYEFRNSQ
jgi:serine/threonine protein kinase